MREVSVKSAITAEFCTWVFGLMVIRSFWAACSRRNRDLISSGSRVDARVIVGIVSSHDASNPPLMLKDLER